MRMGTLWWQISEVRFLWIMPPVTSVSFFLPHRWRYYMINLKMVITLTAIFLSIIHISSCHGGVLGSFQLARGRWRVCTYVWFMSLYGIKQHNIVKQLSSDLKTNEFLKFSMNFKSMSFLFSFSSYISSAKKNGSKNLNKTELSLGFQTFSYNLWPWF